MTNKMYLLVLFINDLMLCIILICNYFSVDNMIMEIINYSENTALYGYQPLFDKPRKNTRSYSIENTEIQNTFDVKAAIAIISKRVKIISRYLWIVPVMMFFTQIPGIVRFLTDYFESYARTVPFVSVGDMQLDYLDSAMSSFVSENISYCRQDGDIVGGSPVDWFSDANLTEPVKFTEYTVQKGDTISGISLKFGLTNISTLIAVNKINNVRYLAVGTKLKIPSVDGLFHTVTENESIESISEVYDIPIEHILDVNDMVSEELSEGTILYIPGAKLDTDTLQKAMGEMFICPLTVKYRLTSKFGPRADPITGYASNHTGIDMACAKGTPIRAAMSGTVIFTGYSSVYGNYVIIKHHDGYQTLYAHMSQIKTTKGARVSQETVIGLVGSTGYSTGPHLHFSVYKNGKLMDPLSLIK